MKRQLKLTLSILFCFVLLVTLLTACNLMPQKVTVTVTYDPNYEGATPQKETVEKGAIVVPPTNITREGFELEGWYKDADCTQRIATTGYKVVTNITFYAKWTVITVSEPVVLQSISAQYSGGSILVSEQLDASLLKVTAHYSDGSSKIVTGFNVGECDTSSTGEKTVTITYTEDGVTKTDEITVNVVARLESIEVEYTGGDVIVGIALDVSLITVTAHYSDESSNVVTDYKLSATVFNEVGQKTVTVTYVEHGVTKTETFNVTVIAATLERIEAVYNGGKVMLGEQPDNSKLLVTAYYNNGTNKTVTNFSVGVIDTNSVGVKDWEISYTDNGVTKSVIVKITVVEIKEPQEKDYDVNVIKSENLSIHFLELGNGNIGDSVYIKAGETDILIDAGSKRNSAPTLANYINKYCDDGILEYVIATHAHEDHIAGFVGEGTTKGIFDLFKCETIIEFAKYNTNSQVSKDYFSKRTAQVQNGANCYTALQCVNNENGAKKVYNLTPDGSITMEILDQKYYHQKMSSGENDHSVCVLISQGDNHYLFTGDLEKAGEESLVALNPNLPEVELYKGGHHGSSTSSNEILMEKVKPQCVCVCSCMGSIEYSQYVYSGTFPTQDFINRVAPYTDRVYVTTYMSVKKSGNSYSNDKYSSANGNIVFACTDGQVTMYFSNNNLKLKDTDWFKEYRTCPKAWA